MKKFDIKDIYWINKPKKYEVTENRIMISTEDESDCWQRTYYGFRHDSGHAALFKINEKFFSFTFKTEAKRKALYDHCGPYIYIDDDNWTKAGIEYTDEKKSWLGSVVTNLGYSDWATTDVENTNELWYRVSRRESDFKLEVSMDGINFMQMRIFHLHKGEGEVSLGFLACSPVKGSFDAVFSDFKLEECKWEEHSL